jgi:hypothetical protein
MDLLVLIDELDDVIHNARPVPLTDQVRVDKDRLYDILDRIRDTVTSGAVPRSAASSAAQRAPDAQSISAAVDAAIKANIPEIARAVAAQTGGSRPQQPPPPGPF